MRRSSLTVLIVSGLLGSVALVQAGAAKDPAALVDARQAEMKKLGGAMKTIGGFVKGGGDVAPVQEAAATVAEVGKIMPGLWHPGTAMGVGDSETLPALWDDPAKVEMLTKAMQAEAAKLVTVAATGDQAAIGAQQKALLGTCKACHEPFKKS